MKPYYRKPKKKDKTSNFNPVKTSIVFVFVVFGLMSCFYLFFADDKPLGKQLAETKGTLMQMDSALEAEHRQLEEEYLQWIQQHPQKLANILSDSLLKEWEGQHEQMIKRHAEIIEQHKKLFDEYVVIEEGYKNRTIESLAIQEQNNTLLGYLDEIKNDRAKMMSDHEIMKSKHEKMQISHFH